MRFDHEDRCFTFRARVGWGESSNPILRVEKPRELGLGVRKKIVEVLSIDEQWFEGVPRFLFFRNW